MNTLTHLPRRAALLALVSLAAAPLAVMAQARPRVTVWKSPTCGCCKDWIAHMEANGFQLSVQETGNNAMRKRLGIPTELGSCHTALVDGYALEGHVPAADVKRLLREKPNAVGLAVPGMPVGSPGMDGPVYKGQRDRFDTLLVLRDGKTQVFAKH